MVFVFPGVLFLSEVNIMRFILATCILCSCIMVDCISSIQPEKSICVVIPSYNNRPWVQKNLGSVYNQKYKNYSIVYLDDCSPDKTHEEAIAFAREQGRSAITKVIRNARRVGALANLYTAIHECSDDTIIVQLDGDDWFCHDHVLELINRIYSEQDIWYTYGQLQRSNNPGRTLWPQAYPPDVIANNTFRKHGWFLGPVRSHYAWLFKLIKLRDLLHYGNFYSITWDVAMLFPLVEMASKGHFRYIPDILYTYNMENSISDYRGEGALEQELVCDYILAKKPYKPLSEKVSIEKQAQHSLIDVLVISKEFSQELGDQLVSRMHLTKRIGNIYQVDPTSFAVRAVYNFVKKIYTKYSKSNSKTTLGNLLRFLEESQSSNIFCITDTASIPSPKTMLVNAGYLLQKHHAQAFFFGINQEIRQQYLPIELPPVTTDHTVCAWQCRKALQIDWKLPVLHNILWDKKTFLCALKSRLLEAERDPYTVLQDFCYRHTIVGLVHDNPEQTVMEKPDVMVIMQEDPNNTEKMHTVRQRIHGIGRVLAFHEGTGNLYAYDDSCKLVSGNNNRGSLAEKLAYALGVLCSKYIIMLTDDSIPNVGIDYNKFFRIFMRSGADIFFPYMYDLHRRMFATHAQPLDHIDPNAYMWICDDGIRDICCLESFDMALWKREDLLQIIHSIPSDDITDIYQKLHRYCCDAHKKCIGYLDCKYDVAGSIEIFVFVEKDVKFSKITRKLNKKFWSYNTVHVINKLSSNHKIVTTYSRNRKGLDATTNVVQHRHLGHLIGSMLHKVSSPYVAFIDYDDIKKIPEKIKGYTLKVMQKSRASALFLLPCQDVAKSGVPLDTSYPMKLVQGNTMQITSSLNGSIWYKQDLNNALASCNRCSSREDLVKKLAEVIRAVNMPIIVWDQLLLAQSA